MRSQAVQTAADDDKWPADEKATVLLECGLNHRNRFKSCLFRGLLKRQVAEADSLQDVGVNIHRGSCNRHTKNRNIKKDRKVESEDQGRKWERTRGDWRLNKKKKGRMSTGRN